MRWAANIKIMLLVLHATCYDDFLKNVEKHGKTFYINFKQLSQLPEKQYTLAPGLGPQTMPSEDI
jgi:hypothetical protein